MRWSREVLDQYFSDGGDQVLRLDHYSPEELDLIVEIGACDGDFTEKLSDQFGNALIIAIEPVPSLYLAAQKRLFGRANVALSNAGLWTFEGLCKMTDDGPASALIEGADPDAVTVQMFDIAPWLAALGTIDLLVMNVEGAEYRLLPRLIDEGIVTSIHDIQIQFHDVADDSYDQMVTIKKRLSDTHLLTYEYPFVMENWRLRW